jgi:ATP-dependent DNA helicase RecQ
LKNGIDVLKGYFGYDTFREGQEGIIDEILSGRDVMGVMPTGAGKSICYQVPAVLMDGMTIVISPLISLMKDQVQALGQYGIPAEHINSSMQYEEYDRVLMRISDGSCKMLYVAPERLDNPDFQKLIYKVRVSMITVDEAHCVSQWGQDFRPSYLKIAAFISAFPTRPVVSAFTATATAKVREDIVEQLAMKSPSVCVTGFDRQNLYFEVRKPLNKKRELASIVKDREDKCGIVYCSTRKAVEEVCDDLVQMGYGATRYHAGLSDGERKANQDDFSYDRKTIMVATNAFGMGIDKSNVGYVVHYNMPKNLESYYQEAGRAGRDGSPADCILLYAPKDVQTNKFLIEKSVEYNEGRTEEQQSASMEKELALLKEMTFYASTTECLRGYILKYFGEQADIFCGHCGNCNTVFEDIDMTTDAQKIVACVHRINSRGWPYGKTMISDVLKGSDNDKIRRAGFDQLSTYGIMRETPKRRIINMIDYLSQEGYLSVSEEQYPVVITGSRAHEVTKERRKIIVKMPKQTEKKQEKNASGKRLKSNETSGLDDAPFSDELFQNLRALRRELADEAGVPAYIIFPDTTLKGLCRQMPQTEDDFLSVSGVGAQKLSMYGESFMNAIREFKIRNNLLRNS